MEKKQRSDMTPGERMIHDFSTMRSPLNRYVNDDAIVIIAGGDKAPKPESLRSGSDTRAGRRFLALVIAAACALGSLTWLGLPWISRSRGAQGTHGGSGTVSVNGQSHDPHAFNSLVGLHDLPSSSRRALVKAATEMRGFKGFVCEVLQTSVSFDEWDGLLKSLFLTEKDWMRLEAALAAPQF